MRPIHEHATYGGPCIVDWGPSEISAENIERHHRIVNADNQNNRCYCFSSVFQRPSERPTALPVAQQPSIRPFSPLRECARFSTIYMKRLNLYGRANSRAITGRKY